MTETRQFFKDMEQGYNRRRKTNDLSIDMLKGVIQSYFLYVQKPEFSVLVDEYKGKYIYNESRVEKNVTKEEQFGLGEIYDYINSFDFDKDHFNIFTTSMILHMKLYSKCLGKEFGGKLRDTTAFLYDSNLEVMDPVQAQKVFNAFIPESDKIFEPLQNNDLFGYIDNCIKLDVELIKIQPFADGNKRTFRALLNLLFKKIEIPPIYIETKERRKYKDCLLRAMRYGDYEKIIHFYYLKICDEIVKLDLELSEITDKPKQKQKF